MKQRLWDAIERYRTAGGSAEHWAAWDQLNVLIEQVLAKLADLEKWKSAVDHEVVITECGPDDWNDPVKMVRHAIQWNIDVALDPAVSSAAQALIDKGKAEFKKQEPVAWMTRAKEILPTFHRTKEAAMLWGDDAVPLYQAYGRLE